MALAEPPRDDLLTLFELTDPGTPDEGLETYLRRSLEVCVEWFLASGATLFLRDQPDDELNSTPASQTYRLAARAGLDAKAPLGLSIRTGEGIAGVALESGEPMLVRDPFEHGLLGKNVRDRRSEIGSSLVVPLQTPHLGMLGVLCLSRRPTEPDFSRKDLAAARSVAGQVALAVANARLYAQARRALSIERELAEAKRLAEIGQMTAAIAHEIRNPLTGMRGAAQMVRALGGEAAEFGGIIEEEIVKLDRLCGDFLDFARPFELDRHPADLGRLAGKVAESVRPAFDARKVALTLETDSESPTISLDPLRMEQVLRNLLLNALEATGAGGRVELRVHKCEIVVADNGKGMTQEQLSRMFTPFFTTRPDGTGLGMSVVKKIVDAHRGRIKVSSNVGEGTTVSIAFAPAEDE